MKTDCFQEGVDARAAGRVLSDNPYCIRTDEHRDWADGWRATLDLDEDDDPGSTRAAGRIGLTDTLGRLRR